MLRLTYRSVAVSILLLPLFVSAQSGLININTASLEELDTLPGVGLTVAQSIIAHRPYASVEEISRADGIGEPGSSSYENIIGLITVGTVSPTIEETNTSETSSSTMNNTKTSSSSSSSAAPTNSSTPIKLSIGKDRASSVGNPVLFKAEVNISNARKGDFKWNFGDGSIAYGQELYHVYEYPGEYVVVLELGSYGEVSARINVQITEPSLSITAADSKRIEISNNSKQEVNLFGRALIVGGGTFVFPKDTFIRPGQNISLSSRVTGLRPGAINDVHIVIVGDTENSKLGQKIESERLVKVTEIQQELSVLEEKLASMYAPAKLQVVVEDLEEAVVEDEVLVQTAAVIKSGWWETLKKFFLRSK